MKFEQGSVIDFCHRKSRDYRRLIKSVLLLCIMSFLSLNHLAAQNEIKISVSFNQVPISSVLREIEKQTKLNFIYNADHLKGFLPVTYSGRNIPLSQALSDILGSKLNFKFENSNVILSPNTRPQATRIMISGLVVDEDDNPLPAVSVYLRGDTKTGTSTKEDGKFEFPITEEKAKYFAVISYLGFETVIVPVSELRRYKKITMKSTSLELGDVIVTGIFKKSADNFTGAASTITAKEISQNGSRNLIQTLHNIDPSINIVENNFAGSNPNVLPELQIRGNSSVPNVNELKNETRVGINTPLVVLDGFETSLQKLYDINDNEVESLTILKDASATAIYGSRGANGVIIITTKMPVMGKLRVNYRGDLIVETPDLTEYKLLNAGEKLALEKRVGLYTHERAENEWPLKRYYNYLLDEVNSGVNTYWLSKPLRVGVGQKHNLRIEGGDKTFRYSASAQYNDKQGVMKGSSRKVFNGSINLSYFLKNVKFTNVTMISLGNTNESKYGNFIEYAKMNPYWRTHDNEGNILKTLGYSGYSDYSLRWPNLPTNPLYNASLNTFNKSNSTNITNNFSLEWKILQGLTFRTRLGVASEISETDIFKPSDHTDFANYLPVDMFRKGTYSYSTGKDFSIDGSANINYARNFKKHMIYAGFDLNIRESNSKEYGFLAEGFNNESFDFITMALQYAKDSKPNGSESRVRSLGLTANINYTYDNKYYIDISGRTDGSSQFGSNKRFAPFWSTGIGWNLHHEDFMKSIPYVTFLKVRGSIGTTGSQNFNAYQAISTYRYFIGDKYFNFLGSELMGLGNKDLQWQQKFNTNIGIEAKFFDNRYSLILDYYSDKTKDLISSISSPASNGFTSYIENVGQMKNHGFEIKASVAIIRDKKREIYWNVTAAAIQNNNKVVEVSQALLDAQKAIESAKVSNPNILYKPGYSTNTLWVVRSAGIDPSNGKEVYINRFGEPTYVWDARDIIAAGVKDPKLQGMINTMFKYKGFTFNASFGYKIGGYAYNSTLIDKVENADYRWNVDSRVYTGRWSQPGDIAAFKGLDVTTKTNKTSRFVQKENVINCQNISLQYELKSAKFMKDMRIENILFTASSSDLFYFSSIKKERGLSYPFSRQFNFSMNITF